jgi:hypothetical protein
MLPEAPEHATSIVSLEHEGWETGCFGAFCAGCTMWIGPHRDTEQEAEGDARRHEDAVRRQQRQHACDHVAVARYDQHEAELMQGMIEAEPENEPIFGPYFAYCADCGGDVGLGRVTEEEATDEARRHHAAFVLVTAAN